MDNCLGDIGLQDGTCPDFKCIGPSSCNNRGSCTNHETACDCDEGFSGYDCSVDLDGETIYFYSYD